MSASEPPQPQRGRTAQELTAEPPKPQRGLTAEEHPSDASAPERELEEAKSLPRKIWTLLKPSFLLSQADGYPVGIKQFLQFSLLLVYPAWVFGILVIFPLCFVAYKVGYGVLYAVLWVLATPFRISHKRDEARKASQPAEQTSDAVAETRTGE